MRKHLFIIIGLFFLLASCDKTEKPEDISDTVTETTEEAVAESTDKEVFLDGPTLIVMNVSAEDIQKMRETMDEEDFMIVGDDHLFYSAELNEKMQNEGIPILNFDDKVIVVKADNFEQKIERDDTFGLSEHFFYDGETLERVDIMELLYGPNE